MNAVDVCNLALAEIGNRTSISSFDDGSPQANIAKLFYTPKMQALARGAPWNGWRGQIALTQLKSYTDSNPPPQPFLYEYAWPSDCLEARFIIPTQTNTTGSTVPLTTGQTVWQPAQAVDTTTPFVVGTDYDTNGSPIKVILTNLEQAQLIYTRDLTQVPDLWDSLFLTAATAYLASYFINALARNEQQLKDQIAIAKNAIMDARSGSGNEGINDTDHIPDWFKARMVSSVPWAFGSAGGFPMNWDNVVFADGLSY